MPRYVIKPLECVCPAPGHHNRYDESTALRSARRAVRPQNHTPSAEHCSDQVPAFTATDAASWPDPAPSIASVLPQLNPYLPFQNQLPRYSRGSQYEPLKPLGMAICSFEKSDCLRTRRNEETHITSTRSLNFDLVVVQIAPAQGTSRTTG